MIVNWCSNNMMITLLILIFLILVIGTIIEDIRAVIIDKRARKQNKLNIKTIERKEDK